MIQSLRNNLKKVVTDINGKELLRLREDLGKEAHPGLVLQRLLPLRPEKASKIVERHPYADLVAKIENWFVPRGYVKVFERWLGFVETEQSTRLFEAKAVAPLALGLGIDSPIENGLAIHFSYGVPYLPGSALKGIARRAAQVMEIPEGDQNILFGTTANAGHIIFWDAWLDPAGEELQPYQQDVLTPHHPDYYRTSGKMPPTDFDDPNPVAFLSVKPNTQFVVAVSSSSAGARPWVELAANLLQWALENLGLGAKTNAGYGFFECAPKLGVAERRRIEEAAKMLEEKYKENISRIQEPGHISLAEKILRELTSENPAARKPVLLQLKKQLKEKGMWNESDRRIKKLESLLEESE